MTQNFKKYSQYFDLLYAGKDYQGEAEYLDEHIQRCNPGASSLLELGSGTGNHAQHLSAAGYFITGIERSAEMAEISAAKLIPGFTSVTADMSAFELDKKFDAVVSLFHSLCYLTTNKQLIDCFRLAHRHLNPRGLFCFDFWYGPGVLNDLPSTRVRKIQHKHLNIVRIAETEMYSEENVAVVNYEMIVRDEESGLTETMMEKHPMRYFSIPELDLLCNQTGFKLVTAETFLKGGTPGISDWNAFIVLQRVDR